mmetsp:Transcript_9783/g.17684  ORF Transcript_9783/g.17684 Transcript_9783/m.17684 type:complete len:254 (+) Transcript_9783:122-883(+)
MKPFLLLHSVSTENDYASRSLQPGSDTAECHLLGNFAGTIAQLLLFCLCVTSLLLKWRLEVPSRSLWIFGYDSSKQVLASCWLHLVNLLVAYIFSYVTTGSDHADECASYWATFIINTTLCLMLNYALLRCSERVWHYRSGKYSDAEEESDQTLEPEQTTWAWQIAVYLGIVTVSRLLVVLMIILPFSEHVASFGVWGTTWIPNLGIRVMWVMVLTPMILDTLSLWITDQFIKFVRSAESSKTLQAPLVPGKQ